MDKFDADNKEGMIPEAFSLKSFLVAGISAEIDPATGIESSMKKIGQLWQNFYMDALNKIPHQKQPLRILGVYSNYESDYRAKYRLSTVCEVVSAEDGPEGFYQEKIPEQNYLRFQAVGQQPDSVIKGWTEVWKFFSESSAFKRAYTFDFEDYISEELVEIFIAVE